MSTKGRFGTTSSTSNNRSAIDMTAKRSLFFGTGNAKKLEEIAQILGNEYELQSFHDLEQKIEVVEDRPDLEGNAEKKALCG